MDEFEEKITFFRQLALSDYFKAESEIKTYLNQPLSKIHKVKLQVELANVLWLNSKIDEAETLYMEILPQTDALELEREKAECLCGIGIIENDSGRFDIATTRMQQAIAIFNALKIPDREAYALNRLAIIRNSQGDLDEAKRIFQKTAELAQGVDEIVALKAINNIALIDEERGKIEEALETYRYCHQRAKELNYTRGIIIMGNNYAGSLQQIGDYAQAKKIFEETMQFAEEAGDIRNIALTCQNYAGLCTDIGDLKKAEHLFEQAKIYYEEIDDKYAHIEMLESYAKLWLKRSNIEKAESLLKEALVIIENSGIHEPEVVVLTSLAEIHFLKNEYDQAYDFLKRGDELAWFQKSDVSRARVLLERARINMNRYNFGEAKILLEEAEKLAKKSKHLELQFKTLISQAELDLLRFHENSDKIEYYQKSIANIQRVIKITIEKKLVPDYINASIVRAMLHSVQYEFDEAEKLLSETMALAESRGLTLQAQRARERLNFIVQNIQSLPPQTNSDTILFSITLEEIQQILSKHSVKANISQDLEEIFIVAYSFDKIRGPKVHTVDNIEINDSRYMQQIHLMGSLYPISLGQGKSMHMGLFGPFPFGTQNLKALVYSIGMPDNDRGHAANGQQEDAHFLICVIYPTKISPFFYDQQKIESFLDGYLTQVHEPSDIDANLLRQLRKNIIAEISSTL